MSNLTIIEHKGIRVLTTQQLAEVYDCTTMQILQNFNNNKERFEDGRDCFKLEGNDLAAFKRVIDNIEDPSIKFSSVLILWTERGANRHSKILDTDKAWQQFDLLEETYFNAKNGNAPLPQMTQTQIILQEVGRIQFLQSDNQPRCLQLFLQNRHWSPCASYLPRASQRCLLPTEALSPRCLPWLQSRSSFALGLRRSVQVQHRAGCRLSIRVKNARDRLKETGAAKTTIDKFCNLDAIEQEQRLKEIYTSIVKELTIRYVA